MDKNTKRKMRPMHKMSDTEQFRDLHAGNKCFVCGAGVSVQTEKELSQKQNMKELLSCIEEGKIFLKYLEKLAVKNPQRD